MEEEKCPACGSAAFLKKKMLLIGKVRNEQEKIEKEGAPPPDQLYADQVDPAHLRNEPIERFVDGLFCTQCEKGFIPHRILS
ncbi:MAG: hypothetical protein K0S33_3774 [Bacteroidetes bacterium]|jgi:hypothetical protein|nr:hypothetical protein [Bacteroidota bacterium]